MTAMWERTARQIEADALDDLEAHRKLQSPAGQDFLRALRSLHSPEVDHFMPWLAREFRKGRVRSRMDIEDPLTHHPVGRAVTDDIKDALREYERYYVGARPDEPTHPGANLGELHDNLTRLNHLQYRQPDPRDPRFSAWQPIRQDELRHWNDWWHQPDRRNVPLEQLKVHDLPGEVDAYEREKSKRLQDEGVEEGRHHGDVVHSWPDGWNVRKLPAGKALDFEAWNMRGRPEPGDTRNPHGAPICVNWPEYQGKVGAGDTHIYSLRDPQGNPHVTAEITPSESGADNAERLERALATQHGRSLPTSIQQALRTYVTTGEVDPGHDVDIPGMARSFLSMGTGHPRAYRDGPEGGEIVQIQGKGNSIPKPEYQARMKDWFQTFPEAERPNWPSDDHITDPEELEGHFAVQDTPAPDFDAGHGGYGPHGDYGLAHGVPEIDYDSAVPRVLRDSWRGSYFEPTHADNLYRAAVARGEVPQLASAVEDLGSQAQNSFDEWMGMQPSDYLPEYPEDAEDDSPEMKEYYEAQNEMAQDHAGMQATNHFYGLLKPHWDPNANAYVNEQPAKPATFSKVASAQPFRRLWAFSPQSGKVHVYDEAEHHPAEVPTHDSIADDLGEVGLHHGYAYSIPGGWRVLDYHHEPVADPFVLRNVVEGLRKRT